MDSKEAIPASHLWLTAVLEVCTTRWTLCTCQVSARIRSAQACLTAVVNREAIFVCVKIHLNTINKLYIVFWLMIAIRSERIGVSFRETNLKKLSLFFILTLDFSVENPPKSTFPFHSSIYKTTKDRQIHSLRRFHGLSIFPTLLPTFLGLLLELHLFRPQATTKVSIANSLIRSDDHQMFKVISKQAASLEPLEEALLPSISTLPLLIRDLKSFDLIFSSIYSHSYPIFLFYRALIFHPNQSLPIQIQSPHEEIHFSLSLLPALRHLLPTFIQRRLFSRSRRLVWIANHVFKFTTNWSFESIFIINHTASRTWKNHRSITISRRG